MFTMRRTTYWLWGILGILVLVGAGCTRERPPVDVTPWTPPTVVNQTPTRARPEGTPSPLPTVPMTVTITMTATRPTAPENTPVPTVPLFLTPPPAPTPTPEEEPGWFYYTVQRGDTLFSIAEQFGITVEELKQLNGLTDDTIYVGQKLRVPGSPPEQSEYIEYVVQPGDTLFSIARRFGVDMQELARLNGITDPSTIYVGQTLRIPATASPARGLYQVQPGDTLSSIAQRFGISIQALMEANGITDPDQIYVGQLLRIP